MKSSLKLLTSLFAMFLMISLPALAQDSSSITGGLSGAVTDATGAYISGATVTLVGPQGTQILVTNNSGRFNVAGLTPGYYDVTVEKPGFKKAVAKHSQVVVNSSSSLNVTLAIGNVDTTVEVAMTSASIDTSATAVTTNLTESFYDSVPIPRNVSGIFYAAPGVAQGQVAGTANQEGPGGSNPSIGGASALENLYIVDGVTITDQAFGSIGTFNRNHGALGTGINLSFIQEVDVKTSAFEPQYGKATGGIVQIVTKSGGNSFHGALGAYLGPGKFYASRHQFYQYGYQLTTPYQILNNPQYDVSAEIGGYVPGFRDKLFFFGAFDPSLSQEIDLANPLNPVTTAHGPYQFNTTTLNWSGKLTFKLASTTTFEASSFGDPSKHNVAPETLSTNFPDTLSTSYRFGSIDSIARVRSAITPTLVGDASFAYNQNHFKESLLQNSYEVVDRSPNVFTKPSVQNNVGAYEPSTNNTYSIAGNLSKTLSFLGQHTFSVGYSYDHTNFLDQPLRSGARYPIPSMNAEGGTLATLFPSIPAAAAGAFTDSIFQVYAANTDPALTLTDNTCTHCPLNLTGQRVYATVYRGTYSDTRIPAVGRYKTAYGNDDYQVNRYVSLNLGLRWEQQQVGGTLLSYTFTDSWSPRVGINIDPVGDHKGKLFFNYGRNFWAMPLDAAIRQLGNEQDDTAYIYAPIVNADGTYTVIPDSAHNLNGLPKATNSSGITSTFKKPSYVSSTGEGIIAGTKGEYEDEYVVGFEREIKSGLVVKARWSDRRLGRILEDIGSQSPEGAELLGPANYNGGIANPGPSTDIAINEQEVTYTPDQYNAAQAASAKSNVYVAPVTGCTADNDVGILFTDGLNRPVGGACITNVATADAPCSSVQASGCTGPGGIGDGKSDGLIKPVRRYQALELELDKRFANHWLAQINYRWGTLYGNYEGAYRNDNGQSDPGISSLFDFTAGSLGLLNSQFANGDLSSDRRNVGNLFLSYTIGSDTPFLGKAKGLQLGTGVRGQSGVPLSQFGDHPIYLNTGEVPIGGRGAAGRTPVTTQLDLHTEYSVAFKDKYTFKLGMDVFNVTNSQFQTGRLQNTQLTASAPGVAPGLNTDYGRPTSFQTPLYARGVIRVEF